MGLRRVGMLLMIMFRCCLRIGEGANLRKQQISIDANGQRGVIILKETKASQRTCIVESVAIDSPRIAACAAELCEGLMPGDRLLQGVSVKAPGQRCSVALRVLGLDTGDWSPCSLRRGGAAFDFRGRGEIGRALIRRRWASTRSARAYIQEAVAALAEINVSITQLSLLKVASRRLPGWSA